MVHRGALSDFIDDLQAAGRLTFTREDAMTALGVTAGALKQAALRLAKRRRLVSPRRGFFIIVPLEYREAGAPPVDRWLPELLRFHGARELEREVEGGEVVVTVDRFLRAMSVGQHRVRFRVETVRR
ncbi:hypothetical protein LBMAG42_51660 [Deltaproteobacteria bacterium]|nr:hypothetical protein LBMAG42_51660 [Deltaproteobacteria bacterium]